MNAPLFVARFFGVPVGVGFTREEAYKRAASLCVTIAECRLESASRSRGARRQIPRGPMSERELLDKAVRDARTRLRQAQCDYWSGVRAVSDGDLVRLEAELEAAEEGISELAFRRRQRDAFLPPPQFWR